MDALRDERARAGQKKQPQKTLKERRSEKRAASKKTGTGESCLESVWLVLIGARPADSERSQ